MIRKLALATLVSTVCSFTAAPALAIQSSGPLSLQNGYPVWWMDDAGFQVGMCLDAACIPDGVQAGNAFSQQIGFGAEAFWWMADADLGNPAGLGLLVLAMEAAWLTETARNGDQFPFGRLRVRVDVEVPGAYTITHPFGAVTVTVPAVGPGPEITDADFAIIGGDVAGTRDQVPPYAGVLASSITHFFSVAGPGRPAPGALFSGFGAIASSNAGGTLPVNNFFRVSGPVGAFGPGVSVLTTSTFSVAGRAFNPGVNAPPTAVADAVVAFEGVPLDIDVTANDTDVIGAANVHGINAKATAIVGGAGAKTLAIAGTTLTYGAGEAVTTTAGGTVSKNPTGTLKYTPPAGFTGVDSFQYVVQDTGGLVSGQTTPTSPIVPGTVSVIIEDLAVTSAVLHGRILKWTVSGTSTAPDGTVISLFAGPAADPTKPVGTAVVTGGVWRFVGKSMTSYAGIRQVSARSATSPLIVVLGAPLAVR
ncbi:MAG: Ig-like domain-containing protein [Deltaproteobacteria bacterium]|nr:Ig-like domain-containing protein [Deltaproteobacteria bacterium]